MKYRYKGNLGYDFFIQNFIRNMLQIKDNSRINQFRCLLPRTCVGKCFLSKRIRLVLTPKNSDKSFFKKENEIIEAWHYFF
jgi:hypothetical protein